MLMRCALLLCLLCAGCAGLSRVNEIAADSMAYSHLLATTKDRALIEGIRSIAASPAHRQLQRVLADFPEDMRDCLIIEAADLPATPSPDEPLIPSVFVLFEGTQSNGFLSNFGFDEDGAITEPDLGWRAAAWPTDETNFFPDDPVTLLPSASSTQPDEDTRLIAAITLVTRSRILTVAGRVHPGADEPPGQTISNHPNPKLLLHLLAHHHHRRVSAPKPR